MFLNRKLLIDIFKDKLSEPKQTCLSLKGIYETDRSLWKVTEPNSDYCGWVAGLGSFYFKFYQET